MVTLPPEAWMIYGQCELHILVSCFLRVLKPHLHGTSQQTSTSAAGSDCITLQYNGSAQEQLMMAHEC